jgi:hypothetical protein
MKLFAWLAIAFFAVSIWTGCSDSTSSTSYPLVLAIDSETTLNNTAIFYFRVTKNGAPLSGARLQRTDSPILTTFDLGIASDSVGNFPYVTIVVPLNQDSMTSVAYQAVSGSQTSNYVRWP